MLALHGYGDHAASVYGGPAPVWAASGIEVHAYDLRGFGHNPSRGRWPGEERLIADVIEQAQAMRRERPGVPLVVLGHSMGAGIVLAALGEGLEADAAILAAPAIAGGDFVGALPRAALWALTGLAPDTRWGGGGIVRYRASDNDAALRALAADPLYIGRPSPREIDGLVRIMDRAAAAAPGVSVPVMVLIGEKDELVKPEQVVAVAQRIPGLDRLEVYPDGWHLLFRDLQGERVWADVRDWVLAQGPARR